MIPFAVLRLELTTSWDPKPEVTTTTKNCHNAEHTTHHHPPHEKDLPKSGTSGINAIEFSTPKTGGEQTLNLG